MSRKVPGLVLALLLCCGLAACGDDDPASPAAAPDSLSVLFIGNSLTAGNSLPAMVDSLAHASGLPIRCTAITGSGTALIDHWGRPRTRREVQSGLYDVVVLQQGPSSLPESRQQLRDWTRLWDIDIEGAGARTALYAVWPDSSRFFAFGDVSESYRLAAEDVDGLFFPVGDTWLETWARDPSAPLYGADDFHPTVTGSYVAAVVIVSVLANRHPALLAKSFPLPPGVGPAPDPGVADTIRWAAAAVIDRHRRMRIDGGAAVTRGP
jgi:hypothetical protein